MLREPPIERTQEGTPTADVVFPGVLAIEDDFRDFKASCPPVRCA